MDRLRVEFERELADDEPIFHEDLKSPVSIFELQRSRLTESEEPNTVMTKYGWAMYSTGEYKYWAPWGQQPLESPIST